MSQEPRTVPQPIHPDPRKCHIVDVILDLRVEENKASDSHGRILEALEDLNDGDLDRLYRILESYLEPLETGGPATAT